MSGGRGRRPPGAPAETPMMTQYLREKAAHPGAILLFRMGDFYETFFEDAETLSRVTGVALTSRNSQDPDPIPLAGFPWHSAETHVSRLLEAGHRVAICEQVEEPGKGKKLLERRVVEVLTPGTTVGESQLEAGANNFLVAVRLEGERVGLAAADVSTGEMLLGDLTAEEAREELIRLAPVELLSVDGDGARIEPWLESLERRPFRTSVDVWRFGRDRARRALLDHLGVATLDAFECEDLGPALGAAGALLEYAREQKQADLGHLRRLRRIRPADGLILDESTLRSLEILEPMPGATRESTLLHVLDETATAGGARRLRAALRRPFADPEAIVQRQEAVASLLESSIRSRLAGHLKATSDLERILARLHCRRAAPRDLAALRQTLRAAPKIEEIAGGLSGRGSIRALRPVLCEGLAEELERALRDDPPAALTDGGVFRDEWDAALAEHRSLARGAKSWIARLQEEERQRTGIPNLKVGYNRVFGYYLEVTKAHHDKVPDRYQRKQTLVGAERYLTPELKEFEQKVLTAEEDAARRERELFEALCERIRGETASLQELAARLAEIDLARGLAEVAARGGYVRPRITWERRISIRDGRHPVVERALGADRFIPNDSELDTEARQLAILTGPNMAGKSTYLRQVGLLVVMAQIGSFVPAVEAEIGICDRVFTRVGAQDALAKGQSTFLLEMIETSRILHHATPASLVLLDEVGRGTSTYDGLAIAWAVAEAIADPASARPRTIFATHFHELTRLADGENGVHNLNVQVKEWGDRVVFVRKVVEGGADRSYGIQVARLAGVPEPVIQRAREVLAGLERRASRPGSPPGRRGEPVPPAQLSLFPGPEPAQLAELRRLDLDRMPPLDALALLHRWKAELGADPDPGDRADAGAAPASARPGAAETSAGPGGAADSANPGRGPASAGPCARGLPVDGTPRRDGSEADSAVDE
jgi:DNA mismatch repair protein MutS